MSRENLDLALGALFVFLDLRADVDARRSELHLAQNLRLDIRQHLARDRLALRNHDFAIDGQVGRELAAFEQLVDTLVALLAQDANFVFKVAPQTFFFRPARSPANAASFS